MANQDQDELSKFDVFCQTLENDNQELYQANEELLDSTADCVSFCLALQGLFRESGFTNKTKLDVGVLEGLVDSVFCELYASVYFLASVQEDVVQALADTATNLKHTEKVPAELVNGYARLAERVKNTKEARLKLKEGA